MLTLPASIAALRGVSATRAPIFLVEILWSSPKYYSSAEQVTWNGHTWEKNRCMSIPSFEAGLIDRKNKNFSSLEIEFDNLADNGSSAFPFTGLEAGQNLEDAVVKLYAYSPDAADGVLLWSGYTKGRKFDGREKKFVLSANFFWDSFDLQLPFVQLEQKGFSLNESTGRTDDDDEQDELFIPLVYGAGTFKFKPVVYNHWSDGGVFKIQFVVSGIHAGLPFAPSDITAANFKLFGVTPASVVEWSQGAQSSAPANLTRFPENQIHPLVAFGYAEFPITNEIKDRLDDLKPHNVKATLVSGRSLVDTGLPSENPVLIIRDLLRDPVFGLGLPSSAFDNTAITSAANYVGTRYQCRYEFRKPVALTTLIQNILADCHCYLTFNNGLIQINAKRNTESSVATFATIDSGVGGRKVDDDFADAEVKDSAELINQATYKYRTRNRKRRIVTLYDPAAQARAGGTAKKVVSDEADEWENGGIYDETQAAILAAITIREEQNGNLFASFTSPFWDSLDIAPGDVITLRTVDVFNNASNRDFRVIKKSIDSQSYLISFTLQIYKAAIYNDDAVALGVDLLRGGDDTSAQGRPPDVIPVSLTLVDVGTSDTEGQLANLLATFTVPAFDPTAEQAEGAFREPPIQEVEIWWHFTDESINMCRRGGSLKVTQTASAQQLSISFQTDYRKTKTVEAFFVSIGANRARAPLGYIPDPLKTTVMVSPIDSGAQVSYNVVDNSFFQVNDYTICEKEINRVFQLAPGRFDVQFSGPVRIPFFDTVSIAHPARTEVSVAKLSYPSLTRSLLTPKFTYPVVTARDILQRGGDGVRVRWFDILTENIEAYHIYWSKDSDANTNANKLGSATPAWYLTDPESPPAGVNLLTTNRQRHHWIPEEDIGPVGTVVYARVAAKNGKRNYSSTLSGLLNSSVAAAGGTSPPTDAPSAPSLALVVTNQTVIGKQGLVEVQLKVFASAADNAKTYATTGATEVHSFLLDPKGKDYEIPWVIDDTNQPFVLVTDHLTPGGWVWRKNAAKNPGGRKVSAETNIAFAVGEFSLDATAITGLAITSIVAIDARHSYVNFQYTQPARPVALQDEIALEKLGARDTIPAETVFSEEKTRSVRGDAAVLVAGLITRTIKVNHPRKNAAQYQIKLVSIDGSSITSAAFSNTSPVEDTGPPNNGVALTIQRAKPKPKGLVVDTVMPTLQMITFAKMVLIIHDNNFTGTGRKFFDPYTATWVSAYPDGTTELTWGKAIPTLPIDKAAIFVGGRTQYFVRVGIYNEFNGGSATYSGDLATPITQPGSDDDAAAATPGALAFPAAPSAANNTVDGDPDKNLARVTLTLAPSNAASFASNSITQIAVAFQHRNLANTADVGGPFHETVTIKPSESAATSITRDFYLRIGHRFRINSVVAINGDKKTETTGAVDIIAGNLFPLSTGDPVGVPSPSFGTITRNDSNNKEDIVPITVAQDGTNLIWLKTLRVRKSINGGAFNDELSIGLKQEDTLHTSPTASKTFNLLIKRKAGASAQYEATIITVGGKVGSSALSAVQTATAGDLVGDTAAPNNGATLPAPTVYFEPGKGIVIDFNLTGVPALNTHLFNTVRVGNSTESLFLDIPSKTATASGATSKKEIGKGAHTNVSITRRKLRELFGLVDVLRIRYFITNSIGETSSSPALLDLATVLDSMTEIGLEVDAKIPAKTMAFSTINMCPGGGYFSSKDAFDGSGGSALDTVGEEWRTQPNRTTGVRIDTIGSTGLKWIKATHLIEISANIFSVGGQLCCFLPRRQVLPGETYALSLIAKAASGTVLLPAFIGSLWDEGNAADITGTSVTIPTDTIQLTTSYKAIGFIFQVSTSYVPGTSPRRQWLRLRFGNNLSGVIHIDNVMLVRNAQTFPWAPALEEAGVQSDVDPSGDTGAGAVGALGGGGNGAGAGGFGAGGAGQIIY